MAEAERKIGPNRGNAGKGRPKGAGNKVTAQVKDALLVAAMRAGGSEDQEGLIAYLERQAKETPASFLTLLGKIIPTQLGEDPDNPFKRVTAVALVAPGHDDSAG